MYEGIKKWWSFISQISGVTATIGLMVSFSTVIYEKILNLYQTNWLYAVSLLIIVLISITFLMVALKNRIKEAVNFHKKEKVDSKLKLVNTPNQITDLAKYIPPDSTFADILTLAFAETSTWAKDATLSTFNFYLDVVGQTITYRTQLYFFSIWKSEELALYYPGLSQRFTRLSHPEEELKMQFFKINHWRAAVTKAYEKVSSRLPSKFQLYIGSYSNKEMFIKFSFEQGKIEEMIDFTYSQGMLVCKDGTSFKIA